MASASSSPSVDCPLAEIALRLAFPRAGNLVWARLPKGFAGLRALESLVGPLPSLPGRAVEAAFPRPRLVARDGGGRLFLFDGPRVQQPSPSILAALPGVAALGAPIRGIATRGIATRGIAAAGPATRGPAAADLYVPLSGLAEVYFSGRDRGILAAGLSGAPRKWRGAPGEPSGAFFERGASRKHRYPFGAHRYVSGEHRCPSSERRGDAAAVRVFAGGILSLYVILVLMGLDAWFMQLLPGGRGAAERLEGLGAYRSSLSGADSVLSRRALLSCLPVGEDRPGAS